MVKIELSGSSKMPLGIAGRVRQLFLMDLPGSPNPPPEAPGVRVFRAGWYWKSNVCGAAVAGLGGVGLFTIIGIIFLWASQDLRGRLWGAGMILYAIALAWALLGGNWAAVYPYAVAIEQGKGFHFYT